MPAAIQSLLMQAAACDGAGGVRLEARPRPLPGPGEALLRLRCAGLCGTDLWKLAYGAAPAGTVLGHEVVGTVEALGAGAAGFEPGDRVVVSHHVACGVCDLCRAGSETLCPAFRDNLLAPGGFSDGILAGERAVRRACFGIPPGVGDEVAVFLEPTACVLRGIHRAQILETVPARAARGPIVGVLGAGAMGLLHLLVLKSLSSALGPPLRVVVSDGLPERRALALRLGADAATGTGEALTREIDRLTRGRGADCVFDTAGGGAALATALAASRPGGAVVLFAHAAAGERAEVDLNALFKAERRLIATYSSAAAEQRQAYRLLVSGRLDPTPLVTHRLPLSRIAEAIDLARSRRALKVLLVPDPDGPDGQAVPDGRHGLPMPDPGAVHREVS